MLPALRTNIRLQLRRTLVRLECYSANRSFINFLFILNSSFLIINYTQAQPKELDQYNVVWTEQSKNAAQFMPCGGGDIGTNVWVENGELFLYLQQSGWFDENNTFLKAGRVRIGLSPNPFAGKTFRQELILKDGYINIKGSNGKLNASINVLVEAFNPVIHINIKSNQKIHATATYESWRYKDRALTGKENNANSWKWAKHVKVITRKDSIGFYNNGIEFFHQNSDSTVFDYAVTQQSLNQIKASIYNPLKRSVYGGFVSGSYMKPGKILFGKYLDTDFKGWELISTRPNQNHSIDIHLTKDEHSNEQQWHKKLHSIIGDEPEQSRKSQYQVTVDWWHNYWNRSFIFISPRPDLSNYAPGIPPENIQLRNPSSTEAWQIARNYNLFRYQLGCNANGSYPTKFNGGLFTVDPVLTDTSNHGTPDYRSWGGGTFTAQNQRLVYWPMLKSGDIDLMKPQFDFYKNLLNNAELRSKVYWHHNGASFTEQIENFGLPNPAEYGYKRPDSVDKGVEHNKWLEYEWDTVLEFCLMILEAEKYSNKNIAEYMPLIESCLVFFDEHYQYEAKKRGLSILDENGHIRFFPGSGGETYKLAKNATSTIAALQTVTKALLQSNYLKQERKRYFTEFLKRIPAISFRNVNGHTTIAPAKTWERINNTEPTQLYPVFPWGMYGVGKPGLDTAINTYLYDTLAIKFRSHIGWKQDNIFAARLGLTDEAKRLTLLKLADSKNKFPTFWGPGFDWTPDHNHGGSGMIGLQEMLLQTDDKKIILFPAWPKYWDVHFKLHAPYNTTVEATIKNGKLEQLIVLPKERLKDVVVVNML